MPVKIITYGGKAGWFLRKHLPNIASRAYLETQYLLRKPLFQDYMQWFEEKAEAGEPPQPCLVSIETINRCNSTCDFCPASRGRETRAFMQMDDILFHKLIGDLKDWGYKGWLNLYVNNEPLMDKKIEERYQYAKRMLPEAKLLLYTNGLLLTKERFAVLAETVDKIVINNYAETMALHDNIQEIYDSVQEDRRFENKDITIQVRYIHEILTNRAGNAPNKKPKRTENKLCVMPFTDMTVYPDGKCGLCCSDVFGAVSMGNAAEETLQNIWQGEKYRDIRRRSKEGRNNISFCRQCDFVDAGIRNTFIQVALAKDGPTDTVDTKGGAR